MGDIPLRLIGLLFVITLTSAHVVAEPNVDFEMKPRPAEEKGFPGYIDYLVEVADALVDMFYILC